MEDKELHDMVIAVIDLSKQRYEIAKNEIEYIMRNNIKDEYIIEKQLDEMLDVLCVYETDEILLTFRRLCRYYFDINPQATADYINFYKQQNDPEETKFGKRKEDDDLER